MIYYFIVNKGSRSGKGAAIWKEAERLLNEAGVDYRIYFTGHRYHATELARELTATDERITLVCVGGDGTVNETVNGIRDFSKVTFGYIPTGSSNDFARALGIPTDTAEAVQNILKPAYYRRVDLGRVSIDGEERLFAVSSGCGFDAAVCHEVLTSGLKTTLNRMRLGKLVYVGVALKRILLARMFELSLTIDGGRTRRFDKVFFAAAMNCRCEGGGVCMTPKAKPDDGKLDIIVVNNIPKLIVPVVLPLAYAGWHTFIPGVHIYRTETAEIATTDCQPLHMDGEKYFLDGTAKISLLPKALTVICGRAAS